MEESLSAKASSDRLPAGPWRRLFYRVLCSPILCFTPHGIDLDFPSLQTVFRAHSSNSTCLNLLDVMVGNSTILYQFIAWLTAFTKPSPLF